MVRPAWVAVAFVGGIALGFVGARLTRDRAAIAGGALRDSPPPARVTAPPDSPAPATPLFGDVPPGKPASPGSAAPLPATAPAAASPPGNVSQGEGAALHRIDVGEGFHQMVDRPSLPGFPNEFGDAHRTLERETRDDSWAYQLEAEMQNSLTAYVSVGDIQVRFLECRATICEMRLYASDSNPNAMNSWQETMQSQPWLRRVEMIGASFNASSGGAEGLWIFRRKST